MTKRKILKIAVAAAFLISGLTFGTLAAGASSAASVSSDPSISISLNGVQSPSGTANTLQILFGLTIIALGPSILIMMTSFTRIIIVLSFIRNALGLQQTPPNQVLVGIALFLTLFIMSPTVNTIYKDAYEPLVNNEITTNEAYTKAMAPLREFMFKNTETSSMNTFISLAGMDKPASLNDIPTRVLIPAFITSELKRAFMMGFMIYLPFLIIDVVVSTTLMSMGMIMLPPTMISLPLKLALFVLVDGWSLTVSSLVQSFK